MKLQRVEIDHFGAFSAAALSGWSPGLNVLYGPNGSGKTTLVHFLRGVMTGYDEARRLGLLPPSDRPVGGAVVVEHAGQTFRLQRVEGAAADRPAPVERSLRGDRSDGQPARDALGGAFWTQEADGATRPYSARRATRAGGMLDPDRASLWSLVFAAGPGDVQTLRALLSRARQDGLEVERGPSGSDRLTRAASGIHQVRAELSRSDTSEREAQLRGEERRLQRELEQVTRTQRGLHETLQQSAAQRLTHTRNLEHRLNWLESELQAAQVDRSEAQSRGWDAPAVPSRSWHRGPAVLTTSAVDQLQVSRQAELEELDRRIEVCRTALAEISTSRHRASLELVRIAGAEELELPQYVRQTRAELSALESLLLELHSDGTELASKQPRGNCACREWRTVVETAVGDLRTRVYRLCEGLSRLDVGRQRSERQQNLVDLDTREAAEHDRLARLVGERDTLRASSGRLNSWRSSSQQRIEQELCECSDHERAQTPVPRRPSIDTAEPPGPLSPSDTSRLERLNDRCRELFRDVEQARQMWRSARGQTPVMEGVHELARIERQRESLQLELEGVREELARMQARVRVLTTTGDVLSRAAARFGRDHGPQLWRWASEYISRLTRGRYVEVHAEPRSPDVQLVDRQARVHPVGALSRGTVDQLSLSLRLALVRAYAERGIQLPLILDEVLADSDHERLQAAVSLLNEFAQTREQQITYLTCQSHLVGLFESHGSRVLTMPGVRRDEWRHRLPRDAASGWSVRGWVDATVTAEQTAMPTATALPNPAPAEPLPTSAMSSVPSKSATLATAAPPAATVPAADPGVLFVSTDREPKAAARSTSRRAREVRRGALHSAHAPERAQGLSADSPVTRIPSLPRALGPRLRAAGIHTVGDLLDMPFDGLAARLGAPEIDGSRLRDWQAEAELLCGVRGLSGSAARLLVACGVRHVADLGTADAERLWEMIRERAGQAGNADERDSLLSLERVRSWVVEARRGAWPRTGRRSQRRRRRPGLAVSSPSARRRSGWPGPRLSRSALRRRMRGVQQPSRPEGEQARPESEATVTGPRSAADHQLEISPALRSIPEAVPLPDETTAWRFYLAPDSPVVEAPSIGPQMAAQLKRARVTTVADLLARHPAELARSLNHPRIREQTIVVWQQQSRLMCCIPCLRGHDAQVLVACGITEPEAVARMAPQALFEIIGPFVATREGERLLRSSKVPDLAEVSEWIVWAQHARPLKAA